MEIGKIKREIEEHEGHDAQGEIEGKVYSVIYTLRVSDHRLEEMVLVFFGVVVERASYLLADQGRCDAQGVDARFSVE
jgi:hypothetical protein